MQYLDLRTNAKQMPKLRLKTAPEVLIHAVKWIGWFPSSGLGTLILQAPAWSFFVKLELQKPHSQAGAWERAKIYLEESSLTA